VIVSAVGNDYGVFTYEQRLQQLVGTIMSVRCRVPTADVVLYDASENPLPDDDEKMLYGMVDHSEFLHGDRYVEFLKYNSKDPSPNKFEKKTVGEIQCMVRFLHWLRESGRRYDRVFKLSGRYELSDCFSLDDYRGREGRCVMLDKEDWYGERVFTLRLWSFDFRQLDSIVKLFKTMQSHTYDLVARTHRLEIIEFTLTKFMEEMRIPYVTVNRIGVRGLMGLGGEMIDQ